MASRSAAGLAPRLPALPTWVRLGGTDLFRAPGTEACHESTSGLSQQPTEGDNGSAGGEDIMLRTRRGAYLEPGELQLLAQAARQSAERCADGAAGPQSLVLAEMAAWMEGVLAAPRPPTCILRPLTSAEATALARRIRQSGP